MNGKKYMLQICDNDLFYDKNYATNLKLDKKEQK